MIEFMLAIESETHPKAALDKMAEQVVGKPLCMGLFGGRVDGSCVVASNVRMHAGKWTLFVRAEFGQVVKRAVAQTTSPYRSVEPEVP